MNRLLTILSDNICYIILWGTIPIFAIVGRERYAFALLFRMIVSATDILFGYMLASYKWEVSSNMFGRWLIKRAFILIIWGLLTIIFWHLAVQAGYWSDNARATIVIWAIPIGFFHLATLQELISILEHAEDMFPEYKMFKFMNAISKWIDKSVWWWLDRKAKKLSDKIDDNLSAKK